MAIPLTQGKAMKNMKRSVRRHHYARLKKKWDRRIRNEWYYGSEPIDEDLIGIWTAIRSRTQTDCSSCIGHINPRVYHGGTLQEKRNLLSFEEQMNDL